MKKQLVIVGIIVLLIAVVIIALVLSLFNQQAVETTIIDINQNPDSYLGKTVTVNGTTNGLAIFDDSGNMLYIDIPLKVRPQLPTPLDTNIEYKFTGIITHGTLDYITCYFLDVTKIGEI